LAHLDIREGDAPSMKKYILGMVYRVTYAMGYFVGKTRVYATILYRSIRPK
jgi:hypothetical protein